MKKTTDGAAEELVQKKHDGPSRPPGTPGGLGPLGSRRTTSASGAGSAEARNGTGRRVRFYRIVDARGVCIAFVSARLALVLVRAPGPGVRFGRVSVLAAACERADGVAARAVAAHVLLVALVHVCGKKFERKNSKNATENVSPRGSPVHDDPSADASSPPVHEHRKPPTVLLHPPPLHIRGFSSHSSTSTHVRLSADNANPVLRTQTGGGILHTRPGTAAAPTYLHAHA